jgi:hypothetical protein
MKSMAVTMLTMNANIGIETGVGFFVVEADTLEGHPDQEM